MAFPEYPLDVPSGRCRFGAALTSGSIADKYETPTGVPLAIHRRFRSDWADRMDLVGWATDAQAAGRALWASVKTPDWGDMAAGVYDADIDGLLSALGATGVAMWLTPYHEPEDNTPAEGTPADWRAMIVRFLDRADALGVTNVLIVPILMSYTWNGSSGRDPADWVVTDTRVPLYGIDFYTNSHDTSPAGFSHAEWNAMYGDLTGTYDKDVAFGEFGGAIGDTTTVRPPELWQAMVAEALTPGSRIKAVCWFDDPLGDGANELGGVLDPGDALLNAVLDTFSSADNYREGLLWDGPGVDPEPVVLTGSCATQVLFSTFGDGNATLTVDRSTRRAVLTLTFPDGRPAGYQIGFARIYANDNLDLDAEPECIEYQLGLPDIAGGSTPTTIIGNEFDEYPEFVWDDGIPAGGWVAFEWDIPDPVACPLLVVNLGGESGDSYFGYTLADCAAGVELVGTCDLETYRWDENGLPAAPQYVTIEWDPVDRSGGEPVLTGTITFTGAYDADFFALLGAVSDGVTTEEPSCADLGAASSVTVTPLGSAPSLTVTPGMPVQYSPDAPIGPGDQYAITVDFAELVESTCPNAYVSLQFNDGESGSHTVGSLTLRDCGTPDCPPVPLVLDEWIHPGLWTELDGDTAAPLGDIDAVTTTSWVENPGLNDTETTRAAQTRVLFPDGATAAVVTISATATITPEEGYDPLTQDAIGIIYAVDDTGVSPDLLGFLYLFDTPWSTDPFTAELVVPVTNPAVLADGLALMLAVATNADLQLSWEVSLDITVEACTPGGCPERPGWIGAIGAGGTVGGQTFNPPSGDYLDVTTTGGWTEALTTENGPVGILIPIAVPDGCTATVVASVDYDLSGVGDMGGGLFLYGPGGVIPIDLQLAPTDTNPGTLSVTGSVPPGESIVLLGGQADDATLIYSNLTVTVEGCCDDTPVDLGDCPPTTAWFDGGVGEGTGLLTPPADVSVQLVEAANTDTTTTWTYLVTTLVDAPSGFAVQVSTLAADDGFALPDWTPLCVEPGPSGIVSVDGAPALTGGFIGGGIYSWSTGSAVPAGTTYTITVSVNNVASWPCDYLVVGILPSLSEGAYHFTWGPAACRSVRTVIEGQLGLCSIGAYQVDLMARGGEIRLDTFESVIDVRWERRLDAISSASIEVAKRNTRCCEQIDAADPYATELCIRRDGVIVFEGPVYEVGESRDTAVILARDVSHWLERRIVRSSIDDSTVPPDAPIGTEPGRDGSLIARDIIRAGFKFDDPNVLDWLYVVEGADITARKTDAEQRPYAFTELSDIARTSIDWTVAGRRMFVMPAQHPLGVLSRINDDDIVGDYTITKMGRDYASRQITVGQGALRSVAGGKSARYGLVEQVNQEQSLTTQEAVDNAANVQYRVTPRPPIWVSLDNGVALRPTAPVTIDELIPGVVFPGHFTQRCQTIQQDFRLQAVSVEFTEGVEQVSIDAVAVGYAFESPDAAYQTGIVIGDSLTALNASLQNTRGGRWADRIEDSGYVADLRVFAIPGATSQTMIDAPLVEPQRSDLFIVFFGANDMNTGIPELMADEITPAEFADNIAWYLTNYPAARQVVVFPWRWTGFPVPGGPVDESTYQAYRVAAITTANRFGAAFVDMGTNTATPEPYIVDWIHANRRGHERIASMVRAVL